MLEFKRWMETSYVQEDVPGCYFLCPTLDNLQQLATKVLHGVAGISANVEALVPFYKGVIMILKGDLTEQLNKLSKVHYDNPHYLGSKGQQSLMRVFGSVAPRNEFYDMLNKSLREFAGELASDRFISLVFQSLENNQLEVAENFNAMVRYIYNAIIKADPQFQKIPISKLYEILQRDFVKRASKYADEKEWRVKPEYVRREGEVKQMPILKIHNGALLWVDPQKISQDVIEQNNLDRVYRVQYINLLDAINILKYKKDFKELASVQWQTSDVGIFDRGRSNAFNTGTVWDDGEDHENWNWNQHDTRYRWATNLLNAAQKSKLQPRKPKWGAV